MSTWGFWLERIFFFLFFTDSGLVSGKALEMVCGNLQCENSENTHQQSTGALMILEVPNI